MWLIHMCNMTHLYVWHDSFICVAWLIHMCYLTHSYVRDHSFILSLVYSFVCALCLIRIGFSVGACILNFVISLHTWNMTHSYVWRDTFICVTWFIRMCGKTHSWLRQNSATELSDRTHSYCCCRTHLCVQHVSFALESSVCACKLRLVPSLHT